MRTAVVRPATAADAPRIAALIAMGHASAPMDAEAAEAEGRHPAYAAAFARVAASGANHLFVAEQAGRVVGTYQLTALPGIAERGRTRGKIESVHVDPGLRGSGVGAAMMRHAVAEARALGIGLLELSSSKSRKDAHRFYERLGFARSHEGFKMALD
ncbi:MAG: GNAT family N-acetyltransferase [Phreatobacter sp.]|uniref:GNAT family N-acetyltransferase n=1 Tax=Phreatobacter sp. TaxID=1966341 RepID=UPI001A542C7B|nr:GNAT family N-acetyltransferase [Phreatobacter sp.]MBL8567541.1 GNAT family N-acetyltransferase [Phreatobacter sp.]